MTINVNNIENHFHFILTMILICSIIKFVNENYYHMMEGIHNV
jgi:hypothetical protein